MWPDNETEVDLLGFKVHSDLLRSVVTDATLLPVTVGVFGDWGSGKSSVMKMLAQQLETDEDVACIYFNGWQFEGYDDAKSALIHSILLELGQHERLAPSIKRRTIGLMKRVDWLRVASIGYRTIGAPLLASMLSTWAGIPTSSGISTPPLPIPDKDDLQDGDITEFFRKNPANQGIDSARQFRDDFEDLIKETNLKALVILIDDLDRCEPQRLVETLEAIKLFLAVPRVAFVISGDTRIVRYAISKRYEVGQVEASEGSTSAQMDLVTDYLEKLIQIPYHLPRLSPGEIETYISLLYCQLHLGADFEVVYRAYSDRRAANITSTFGQQDIEDALAKNGKAFNQVLRDDLALCNNVALSLSDVLKGNPRQTKRLLNALRLRQKLAKAARLELASPILLKLMLLEYMRSRLFGQLYKWQAASHGSPTKLRALEEAANDGDDGAAKKVANTDPDWADSSVLSWLRMQPQLSTTDLRDYFWITRDRITDILSGVSSIPPHIRQLLTDVLQSDDGIIATETRNQTTRLSPDEQIVFFEELAGSLRRKPSHNHSMISAWASLAGQNPRAGQLLLATLEQLSPSIIEPTVPPVLTLMAQERPEFSERTLKLFQTWAKENTALGRAATDSLKDLDQ